MSYELKGTIKQIGDVQSFGSNGFTKRQFVVTTDEQYPQDIPLEFVKDKCAKLDNHHVGESVTVSFNLRGREWKENHYVNLNAWRIMSNVAAPAPAQPAPASEPVASGGPALDEEPPF